MKPSKTPPKKWRVLAVHVPSLADYDAIKAAAKKDGHTVSQWAYRRLMAAARKAK
jgi:hypothetical protein